MMAEKNINAPRGGQESAPSVVSQPAKIEMQAQLGAFLEEVNRISETSASGPGEQWSGSGSKAVAAKGSQASATAVSARDQAIAAIPVPAVMQKELEKHIRAEVKQLRKQAQMIARMSKPGAAYHLNQLYTRIHHLNALLAEIFEASYDVLKRFFIRVFIDKQPIL
jgi:hypothetical protein